MDENHLTRPRSTSPAAKGSSERASLPYCRGPGLCQQMSIFIWQKRILLFARTTSMHTRSPSSLWAAAASPAGISSTGQPGVSHHQPLSAPPHQAMVSLGIKLSGTFSLLSICRIPAISHPDQSDFRALIQQDSQACAWL